MPNGFSVTGTNTTPPKGVLAGESIPRENAEEDYDRAAIEAMVVELKQREPFKWYSDDELNRIAREKLEEM